MSKDGGSSLLWWNDRNLIPHVVVTDLWMVVTSLVLNNTENMNFPDYFLWQQPCTDRESYFVTAEWRWMSKLSMCSLLEPWGLEGAYYQPVGTSILCPMWPLWHHLYRGVGVPHHSFLNLKLWESRFLTWYLLGKMGAGLQFVWDIWLQ